VRQIERAYARRRNNRLAIGPPRSYLSLAATGRTQFNRRRGMLGIGEKLPDFKVVGVKPKFMKHEENGQSAFEPITNASFPGKWKVIFFYPKDFTFVCPTEIAEFARLGREFEDRDAVVMGGSTDNEFSKLAWRRDPRRPERPADLVLRGQRRQVRPPARRAERRGRRSPAGHLRGRPGRAPSSTSTSPT
jgi:hypothetical protein